MMTKKSEYDKMILYKVQVNFQGKNSSSIILSYLEFVIV
jgi:hypothetical protein